METYKNPSPRHVKLTTEKGIEYLNQHGVSSGDWKTEDLFPGRGVYVYPLDNGEIVTLESGLRDGRPAFVFANRIELQRFLDADSFPLEEMDMTWLEINAKYVENFLEENQPYYTYLSANLGIQVPFQSIGDSELAYYKVKNYINRTDLADKERASVSNLFSLAIAKFLVQKMQYKYTLRKHYDSYNPYYQIFITKKGEDNEQRNIFSAVSRALVSKNIDNFRIFYWYATGIPPIANIE